MRIRVYIAIILLLLLLIVSQVCASDASRLSKEPTYKIWAFNSINKVTKVTIIGSGPGCPYGLNPAGWSKTIALKRLCLLLCIFVSQNSPNHIMLKKNCQVPLHPQHVESKIRYCSLRSQQLGQNPFQITFGDGILPRMSRDFAIFMAKHLAGYYLWTVTKIPIT